jgi:cell division protein FtsL
MLQAESNYARDWKAYDLPDPITRGRIVRKTVHKVNHQRNFLIKTGFLVFSFALLLVFLCNVSSTLGYQIEQLNLDIQNLQTANDRLDFQIAQKSSLDNVERVAVTNLGMYKPDDKTSIAMEVKPEPVQVASAAVTAPDDKSLSQKILDKMYSSLSRLAQNSK